MKKRGRSNRAFSASAILFCLVMTTTCFIGGIYARYITAGMAQDNARVAQFSVTQEMVEAGSSTAKASFQTSMLPGETKTYQISLSNQSEVAVGYTVTAANKSRSLPLQMKLADGTEGSDAVTATGEFSANGGSKTITLTIRWPDDQDAYIQNREVDLITVTMICKQID